MEPASLELFDENTHCLFCLGKILPYTVCAKGASSPLNYPTLEVLSTYLNSNFHSHCHRSLDAENDEGIGARGDPRESIFNASCEKFLCSHCFECVLNLMVFQQDLENAKAKIHAAIDIIKTVILANPAPNFYLANVVEDGTVSLAIPPNADGNFDKEFENHVKLVTQSSTKWKPQMTDNNAVVERMPFKNGNTGYQQDGNYHQPSLDTLDKVENQSHQIVQEILSDDVEIPGQVRFQRPDSTKSSDQIATLQGYTESRKCNHPCHECSKTFKCPRCGRRYVRDYNFEKHMVKQDCHEKNIKQDVWHVETKTYDPQKKHLCQHCGKLFSNPRNLYYHLRIHSEPRFNCSYCYRKFKHRGDLICHERTHTGVKPFKCDICQNAFTCSSARNQHRKRHLAKT